MAEVTQDNGQLEKDNNPLNDYELPSAEGVESRNFDELCKRLREGDTSESTKELIKEVIKELEPEKFFINKEILNAARDRLDSKENEEEKFKLIVFLSDTMVGQMLICHD